MAAAAAVRVRVTAHSLGGLGGQHASTQHAFDIACADDLQTHPRFDDFVSVAIAGHRSLPPPGLELSGLRRWPAALQQLTIEWCRLERLPDAPMPPTLRQLAVRHNRLSEVPRGLGGCHELEEVDLEDNYIGEVDGTHLPRNLITLNLAYNQVRRVDWPTVPGAVHHLNLGHNFLTELPPTQWTGRAAVHHNTDLERVGGYGAFLYGRRPQQQQGGARPAGRAGENTLYEGAQNVHASSVQRSVTPAIKALVAASERSPSPPRDWLAELVDAVWPNGSRGWGKGLFGGRAGEAREMHGVLTAWCEEKTVHSNHAITMRQLLEHVWRIARAHPDREGICACIKDEVESGRGLCFTGRFTRVLNSLAGFVDGVEVHISPREQLQARMAALWAQLEAGAVDALRVDAAVAQACDYLGEACAPDAEFATWLAPFEGLLG
jgi:hypothetical protein